MRVLSCFGSSAGFASTTGKQNGTNKDENIRWLMLPTNKATPVALAVTDDVDITGCVRFCCIALWKKLSIVRTSAEI
jgi:hypothetical protein